MKRIVKAMLPRRLWKLIALHVLFAFSVMCAVSLWPLIKECRLRPGFFNNFLHAKYIREYNGGGCAYGLDNRPYPIEAIIISDCRQFQLGEEICPDCAMSHGVATAITRTDLRPILEQWIEFKGFCGIDLGPIYR